MFLVLCWPNTSHWLNIQPLWRIWPANSKTIEFGEKRLKGLLRRSRSVEVIEVGTRMRLSISD